MLTCKQSIARIVFGLWMCIFAIHYIWGSKGVMYGCRCAHENREREATIAQLQQDIAQLKRDIALWQTDPFYQEKIAREQLQLARPGDTIYYL